MAIPNANEINLMQDNTQLSPVSFWQAFAFWLKLGFISFGGPAGQIAILHQELVERRRWISEKRFLHALNYCMLLPGPEAQQLATYIGWLMHKTRGGVAAGLLFVLPSLLILIALSWLYIAFGDMALVAGVFYGIKPAVTAIVLQAVHRIGSRALKNRVLWSIAAAAFVAIFFWHLPFPYIVLAAALMGYVGSKFSPQYFNMSSGHAGGTAPHGAALIDDTTPTPAHARFSWARFEPHFALRRGLMGLTHGWPDRVFWLGAYAHSDGLVFYQGSLAHFWWRICGAAVCLSGRG